MGKVGKTRNQPSIVLFSSQAINTNHTKKREHYWPATVGVKVLASSPLWFFSLSLRLFVNQPHHPSNTSNPPN